MEEKALFDKEIMGFMIELRKKIQENPQTFKGKEVRKLALEKFPGHAWPRRIFVGSLGLLSTRHS